MENKIIELEKRVAALGAGMTKLSGVIKQLATSINNLNQLVTAGAVAVQPLLKHDKMKLKDELFEPLEPVLDFLHTRITTEAAQHMQELKLIGEVLAETLDAKSNKSKPRKRVAKNYADYEKVMAAINDSGVEPDPKAVASATGISEKDVIAYLKLSTKEIDNLYIASLEGRMVDADETA